MSNDQVTVVYEWTAHAGKLDELTAIYRSVTEAMERDEPGAEAVHVHVSPDEDKLYVRDDFRDADAVGFHLGTTAAAHFPQLLAIADPGRFLFLGEVPEQTKQAVAQMGLDAHFGSHDTGFDR
ncbi:MAG: antibiotic biosynthesis monooxygenase [Actinomycetota bacterium]